MNDFGDFVRILFTRDGTRIVEFTVQFEIEVEGSSKPVVRYDTAHGFAHRDMLGWNGDTLGWQPMRARDDFQASLTEAIDDLKINWERYRADFMRRRND